MIQAGLSGLVGGHVFSFAALGCLVVRCCRPHRVGRLFGLTRCALPRRRHLAAPSLTPFTHFGDWRRFPALRAVDHCARLLLCSMGRAMCWAGQGANPARSYVGFTSSSFLPTRLDNRSPAWPSSMPAHTVPTGRFAEHPPPAPPSTHHVPRFSQRRRPTHHPQFLRNRSVVTADPLTLSLRFAAMGVTVPKSVFRCNRNRYKRFDFNYLSGYVVRYGRKKTASGAVWWGGAACYAASSAQRAISSASSSLLSDWCSATVLARNMMLSITSSRWCASFPGSCGGRSRNRAWCWRWR